MITLPARVSSCLRHRWFAMALMLLCAFSNNCAAQTTKQVHSREQLWLGYFNQVRLSKRWGTWLDVHYRRTDNFIDNPFQFLVRPAAVFYLKDNLRLMAGYCFAAHFPVEGKNTTRPEHRLWQQVWWNQKFPGITVLQWLRLEERYNGIVVNDELQEGYNFNYRIRYNLALYIPLVGKEIGPKKPYIAIGDELFINFGKRIVYNTFDQNRLSCGIGYPVNKHVTLQLGYMNLFQQEASGNSYISSHCIRFYLYHTIDARKPQLQP